MERGRRHDTGSWAPASILPGEDREGPSHLPLFFPGSLVGDVGPQAGNLRLREQELLPSEKGAVAGPTTMNHTDAGVHRDES